MIGYLGKPYVLKHYYIREGESLPDLGKPYHVASRESGTGLDVWYFEPPDELEDEQPTEEERRDNFT